MSHLEKAEEIAERLRQDPYHFLTNDCFIKAVKLKRECQALGIPARVVACIGLSRARLLGLWLTIPVIHGWAEVEGKRIEVARPPGSPAMWGIIPVNVRPVIAIWF